MIQFRRRVAVLDDETTQPGASCDDGSELLGGLWRAKQAGHGSGAACPWCTTRVALGVAERGAYRWQCVRCGWLSEWFSVVAGAARPLERPPSAQSLVYREETSGVRPLPDGASTSRKAARRSKRRP